MTPSSASAQVRAKWVLTGEHSVLVGQPALALPHPDLGLTLRWSVSRDRPDKLLRVEPVTHSIPVIELWRRLNLPGGGVLALEGEIPLGAGFGSSAALCVGICRIAAQLDPPAWSKADIPGGRIFHEARRLEDLFHGKSSGMDIAVVERDRPVFFLQEGPTVESLDLREQPTFTFHDTGVRARTRSCVEQVRDFRMREPERATLIDRSVGDASRMARAGLEDYGAGLKAEGLAKIARAMDVAQAAFREWGLVPAQAFEMEVALRAQGALSVKMTGSGGGGFLVALWSDPVDRR